MACFEVREERVKVKAERKTSRMSKQISKLRQKRQVR